MTYGKIDKTIELHKQGVEDQQIREIVNVFLEEWRHCPNEQFQIEKVAGGVTNHCMF
jgi:hypothetical protein